MIVAAFLCLVAQVHDADTITCADRTRVRIAGIEANELGGGCHVARCPTVPGPRASQMVARMLVGRRLACIPVGKSFNRIVATCRLDGRDVGCAIVWSGAAVEWPEYRRRYKLAACRPGQLLFTHDGRGFRSSAGLRSRPPDIAQ